MMKHRINKLFRRLNIIIHRLDRLQNRCDHEYCSYEVGKLIQQNVCTKCNHLYIINSSTSKLRLF